MQGCTTAAENKEQSPRNNEQKENGFKPPFMKMMVNNPIKEEQNEDLENSNINIDTIKKNSKDKKNMLSPRDSSLLSVNDYEKSRS